MCTKALDETGYKVDPKGNYEASDKFDVKAECDTAGGYEGTASVGMCGATKS